MKNDKYDKSITKGIDRRASIVVEYMCKRGLRLATAESCTGGMLSAAVTSVSGASEIYELGVCSYSNRIKHEVLGVSDKTLERRGAVSEQTALEMANGIKRLSGADIAVSITGIAGPTGGTAEKPVGTVWVAVAAESYEKARNLKLYDRGEELTREYVRQLTTYEALDEIMQAAKRIDEARA